MTTSALRVRDRLRELEQVIEHGVAAFIEVGEALAEIIEGRLYHPDNGGEHETFEAYAKARWAWSRSYAYRQIKAAKTAALLPIGNKPKTESQARALYGLPAQEAAKVMEAVHEEHGDRVTAEKIERRVRSMAPRGRATTLATELLNAIAKLGQQWEAFTMLAEDATREERSRVGVPARALARAIQGWSEET